ncbi:uncharacterized protein TNCV_2882231 [Trichonephila clavipes]|nr:uncharacterized protein TNCV_2882231 [Trichonephila clavipes]
MAWGVIAHNTWSPLVLNHGAMTAQQYVRDILQPHVLPLMQGSQEPFFNKTILGLTRQGCHKTVTTLPWPFQFPDQSPIQYIWDHLG